MDTFQIASLNLNVAWEALKCALVYQTASQKRSHVLYLQETHSDLINETDWSRVKKGHNTLQRTGVGFLFSKTFTLQ